MNCKIRGGMAILGVVLATALTVPALGALPTWTPAGPLPASGQAIGVAINFQSPTTLFVATGNAVYRSQDGGSTWSDISNSFGTASINGLVMDPTNPNVLYASLYGNNCNQGGIYKTTDGGNTWTVSTPQYGFSALAIAPSNTAILYCWSGFVVYQSSNAGATWSAVSQGFNPYVLTLTVSPSSPTTLYAGTSGNGVFKSTDGGVTWQAANNGLPVNSVVQALVIDSQNPNKIYVGTEGAGVYESTDGGSTWAATGSGGTWWVNCLAINPQAPTTLYAGTNGGIFESTDGGVTWSYISGGLSLNVLALVIDPDAPTMLLAGTSSGAYETANGATNWTLVSGGVGTPFLLSLVVDPLAPQTLYAAAETWAVFKSTDSGATWAAANSGIASGGVWALAMDPANDQTLYAATDSAGIFKTTDGGATWTAANGGLPNAGTVSVGSIAINPANGVLYAGTAYYGIFTSSDGGASWTSISNGLPEVPNAVFIDTIAVAPGNPSVLYAGDGNGGGAYMSTDGGSTWSAIPALQGMAVNAIAIDPQDHLNVYAGAWGGVYKSTDGGITWFLTTQGLNQVLNIEALTFSPKISTTLFAGDFNGNGVFYSADGGNTWASTGIIGSPCSGVVTAIAASPTGCSLYAGTWGQGILSLSSSVSLTPSTLPGGLAGAAYSATLSATDGIPPYSYAVTAGSLPAGLTLSSAGVLSGTPTQPGSYAFTVTATDASGCTGSQSYKLSTQPPVVTGVTKLINPFRLKVKGSNFKSGIQVFIGGSASPWGKVLLKSAGLLLIKGGGSLKALFPKGQSVAIKLVNTDGGTATTSYTR